MQLYLKIKQTLSKWWDVGTINPERDEAKMPVLLLWVERAAIMVVAVVSGIAVAVFGYMKAADYTSLEIVRWLSAGLMFFLATAITDVGVKYFIQKGAFDFFAAFNPATYKKVPVVYNQKVHGDRDDLIHDVEGGKGVIYVMDYPYNWFQRAMQVVAWLCMVAIVAGLFWFDYVSVDSVRRPVANLVKKETKLNQDSIRRSVDAQEQARIGATVAAVQAIEIDIRNVQKQIEREKTRVLNSDKAMKKLYDNGHGWARGQVATRQAKAIAPLKDRENQLYSTKQELIDQRAKDIAYRSTIIAKTDSSVLAENAAIDGRNTSLVEGTSSLFIWMGFYAKCIAGLIRILLVVMFMGGNVKDYNGDGKIDHTDVNAAAQAGFQPG